MVRGDLARRDEESSSMSGALLCFKKNIREIALNRCSFGDCLDVVDERELWASSPLDLESD